MISKNEVLIGITVAIVFISLFSLGDFSSSILKFSSSSSSPSAPSTLTSSSPSSSSNQQDSTDVVSTMAPKQQIIMVGSEPVSTPHPVQNEKSIHPSTSTTTKTLAFQRKLQSLLKSWTSSLLNPKSPNLEWNYYRKEQAHESQMTMMIDFKHLLPTSNDPLLVDEIFSKITIEGHGDSTLRELVKFLINRFKLGELEKKDANMTYRIPKFFSKELEKKNNNNKKGSTIIGDFLRVAFRFDFFGESFLEPYETDQVPRVSTTDFTFFENSKANIALLSAGSHVAKTLLMDKKISDPDRLMKEGILDSIIYPTQDFLFQRVLKMNVVRKRRERRGEEKGNIILEPKPQDHHHHSKFYPHPKADLILFFMQSVECEAMRNSQLSGFRKMANFCPQIQSFLNLLHEKIKSEISDVLLDENYAERGCSSSNAEKDVVDENVLCHSSLTKENRKLLAVSFLYVGSLDCAPSTTTTTVTTKQKSSVVVVAPAIRSSLTPSKPHCSRDGIHLRSKYLRLKLDLLFNIVVNWWREKKNNDINL